MKTHQPSTSNKGIAAHVTSTSDGLWRSIFEHLKETVMTVNRRSEITSINHVQLGYNKADVIGKSIYQFISPDKKALLKKKIARLLRTSESFDFENRISGPDGSIAWFYSVYSPIFDSSGNVCEYMIITHNITPMKEAQHKLLTAMIDGQEAERRRVSAELHDGLGQYISAIQLSLQKLEDECRLLGNDNLKQSYNTITTLVGKASEEVRAIARNLAPPRIEEFGLVAAIEDFCEQVKATGKLRIHFKHKSITTRPAPNLEINLYRIIQELLNNVMKHAQATRCSVQLTVTSKEVMLKVADNGKVFNAARKATGLGLQSIRARVNVHKGTVQFTSAKGKGTTVVVTIPVLP